MRCVSVLRSMTAAAGQVPGPTWIGLPLAWSSSREATAPGPADLPKPTRPQFLSTASMAPGRPNGSRGLGPWTGFRQKAVDVECNCRAEPRARCNNVHEVDPRRWTVPRIREVRYRTEPRTYYRMSADGSSVHVDGFKTPKPWFAFQVSKVFEVAFTPPSTLCSRTGYRIPT